MKSIIYLFLLTLTSSYSQDYFSVDKKVRQYPLINNIDHLAIRILNDFDSDKDKVRAAYTWIAHNIRYDTQKFYSYRINNPIWYFDEKGLEKQIKERDLKKIQTTLLTKKALCDGYALLFKKLCNKLNIQALLIKGLTKTDVNDISSNRSIKDHAWNIVFIDNEWKLIDVTWASGYITMPFKLFVKQFNDSYFFTDPKEFIMHHYPEHSEWQLLDFPINKQTFFKKPIFYQDYYNTNIKLSDSQRGLISLKRKENINIIFDSLPETKKIYYTSSNFLNKKRVRFKNINGQYIGKIKVTKKIKDILTLFHQNKAIINFKLEIKN